MPRTTFGMQLIAGLLDRQAFPWRIDENVIAFWSQQSSRAGKKAGNTAAIAYTARHYGTCVTSVYKEISVFKHALTAAVHTLSDDPAALNHFSEAVYCDRGSNQRLRFEAAIAVTAAHAQRLGLVTASLDREFTFYPGPTARDRRIFDSLVFSDDVGVQADLVGLAQSLVAAAHAAMTGFLHVAGRSEQLCRRLSRESTGTIFRADHPDSRWLSGVGLSWLPQKPRDPRHRARTRELRALGFQTIASAYRQLTAHRRNPREQQRYLSLAKRFALDAQQFRAPGGVNAPFLKTFDVLDNPDAFEELPWKSKDLGMTEALEIANAGIIAGRFREAQAALDTVASSIPDWHLPVRSRAVRLQFACRLALGRSAKHLRDEAHALCRLLPHDFHMLALVEQLKGDLRSIYPR